MAGLTIHTSRAQTEAETMSVTLKQRTYRTPEGRAVAEGDPDAAFLVGPPGARVSDEQAKALGLVNGAVPEKAKPAKPESERVMEEQREQAAKAASQGGNKRRKDQAKDKAAGGESDAPAKSAKEGATTQEG